MRQTNIGDVRQISTSSMVFSGVVSKVERIETETNKGTLESYICDGYGETGDFFYSDNGILDTEATDIRVRSGIPSQYVYKYAKDFDWTCYKESVVNQRKISNAFIINFQEFRKQGRGLYISSATKGSGKTMLACCIANEIIKKYGTIVKFITLPDYIELVKQKDEASKGKIEALYNAGLLILDDMGAETDKQEWITNAVFRLVDRRSRDILPTIYTSNYEMEKLKGDERTVSRVLISVPIYMPEESIRMIKAQKDTELFLKNILQNN